VIGFSLIMLKQGCPIQAPLHIEITVPLICMAITLILLGQGSLIYRVHSHLERPAITSKTPDVHTDRKTTMISLLSFMLKRTILAE
jgi:uncharacterized membrane protein YjjP (DUF1212 family)